MILECSSVCCAVSTVTASLILISLAYISLLFPALIASISHSKMVVVAVVRYHTTIIMFSRLTCLSVKLSRPFLSRPFLSRPFFSFPSRPRGWAALAWETQERLLKSERCRLNDKIGHLQSDLLRLQNNFNLRGALEFSLEQYQKLPKVPHSGKKALIAHLTQDPGYQQCLQDTAQRLQLRTQDINACTEVLYHELSKHAHGNTSDLVVNDHEHTITEVAALEAVFCALKAKGCFNFPLKIIINNNVYIL